MKRLSFFALTSLMLSGVSFDVQASEQLLQQNRDMQKSVFKKIVERSAQIISENNINNDFEAFMDLCEKDAEIVSLKFAHKALQEAEKNSQAIVPYVASFAIESIQNKNVNEQEVALLVENGPNQIITETAIVPYVALRDQLVPVQLPLVLVQLPFLKRHETAIKRIGGAVGGVATVAAVAYAIKNPQEAKQKLQAAGNKAVEVGGKVTGVLAQGAGKLVNGAEIALNAAKDRMPSASTVVNAVRNRMPSSSSLPSLSSLNPFKK